MNKKDLIIVLAYLMYKVHCLTKEQFSYQEPTQAIKNLGKLAKQLTKGGLTIPGNVTITGNLNVGIPDKNGMYNGTVKANMLHGDTCFVNHVNCTGDVKAPIIKVTTQVNTGTLWSNDIKTNYLTSNKKILTNHILSNKDIQTNNLVTTNLVANNITANKKITVEGQSALKNGDVITLGPQFEKLGLLIVEGSRGNYSSTSVVNPKNNNQGWGERWIIKKLFPELK